MPCISKIHPHRHTCIAEYGTVGGLATKILGREKDFSLWRFGIGGARLYTGPS